jgi:hypothetical protein
MVNIVSGKNKQDYKRQVDNRGLRRDCGCNGNGFISLQNANQTWNIPLTSLSNHLVCKTRLTEHGPLGVLTHEEDLTIVGWIFNMQNFGMLITL